MVTIILLLSCDFWAVKVSPLCLLPLISRFAVSLRYVETQNLWFFSRILQGGWWSAWDGGTRWMMMDAATGCLSPGRWGCCYFVVNRTLFLTTVWPSSVKKNHFVVFFLQTSGQQASDSESKIFWIGLIVCPGIWVILAFSTLISFKIKWVVGPLVQWSRFCCSSNMYIMALNMHIISPF